MTPQNHPLTATILSPDKLPPHPRPPNLGRTCMGRYHTPPAIVSRNCISISQSLRRFCRFGPKRGKTQTYSSSLQLHRETQVGYMPLHHIYLVPKEYLKSLQPFSRNAILGDFFRPLTDGFSVVFRPPFLSPNENRRPFASKKWHRHAYHHNTPFCVRGAK